MSNEPSPRPWHTANFINGIEDANNGKVAANIRDADAKLIVDAVNYYKPDLHCDWRELTPEDAVAHCREVAARLGDTPCARDHLQLAAWIEERDRLRDIVRQALPFIEGAVDTVFTILADAEMSKAAGECGAPPKDVLEAFVEDGRRVLREARAAIGEDKP